MLYKMHKYQASTPERITRKFSFRCAAWLTLLCSPFKVDAEEEDAILGKNALILKTATGWQSNIFEVNDQREPTTGDWFQESSLLGTFLLDGKDGNWTANLNGRWKKYLTHNEVDEYLIKQNVAWQAITGGDTTLTLDVRAARLRERVSAEFARVSENSQPGWSGGAGWNLEKQNSRDTKFTWQGGADWQWFDDVPYDNLMLNTSAEFEIKSSDAVTWSASNTWDFRHYRQRPPDVEPPGMPASLSMLEGRAAGGVTWKLDGGWWLGAELNGGCNFDLTNGYYDAGVTGARAELRWEGERWKFKATVEPEWVWFRNRPTNIGSISRKLASQEYICEVSLNFTATKHLTVFVTAGSRLQRVNADESRDDAILNRFTDRTVLLGATWIF